MPFEVFKPATTKRLIATRRKTSIFPNPARLKLALDTSPVVALAFARAVGEYGSVIFIAGNRPMVSEIVPLLIVTRLEQFDYPGAALLGTAMLALSVVMLLVIQRLSREATPHAA